MSFDPDRGAVHASRAVVVGDVLRAFTTAAYALTRGRGFDVAKSPVELAAARYRQRAR